MFATLNMPIPELLVNSGFLTPEDRQKIAALSAKTGQSFIKVALNFGYLSRKNYELILVDADYKIEQIRNEAYDPKILEWIDLKFADERIALPLRIENNRLVVLMADPTDQFFLDFINFTYSLEPEIIVASDLDILWLSHKLLGENYVRSSVYDLYHKDPKSSAMITFSKSQLACLFIAFGLIAVGMVLDFKNTSILLNVLLSVFFLVAIIFKLFLALVGSRFELHQAVTLQDIKQQSDGDLPIYTILLPVYKEDNLIKKLIWNMQSIDYPREKLDIKLVIEEDDDKTLNAVRNLDFPAIFEVIVVPFHQPKTKPKACNYALRFARGKLLTIYDAEDIPDTDQLKKVVALFNKLPDNYICIQSALNYFNRNENFLTRMFTLEYSYWFDYILPGLDTLDIPIPRWQAPAIILK